MADDVRIRVDGREVVFPSGTNLCAALLECGFFESGDSDSPLAQFPLCGMGVCYQCRATVNGLPHIRTCVLAVEEGMEVRRGE